MEILIMRLIFVPIYHAENTLIDLMQIVFIISHENMTYINYY